MKTNHFDIVSFLLEIGADPDIPNSKGKTPFELAMLPGNEKFKEIFDHFFPEE